jgi:hypothetical protein
VSQNYEAGMIFKTDDDVYVNIPNLIKQIDPFTEKVENEMNTTIIIPPKRFYIHFILSTCLLVSHFGRQHQEPATKPVTDVKHTNYDPYPYLQHLVDNFHIKWMETDFWKSCSYFPDYAR